MKLLLSLFISITLYAGAEFQDIKSDYFKSYDYERMGKYSEAIKVLTPLYNKYPRGYTLNLRFGWLFYLNKNYNNSIEYYKKAIAINPTSIDPRLGLVRVYLDSHSFNDAKIISYEILKIDYYSYYANLYLIQALIGEEKYSIAQEITNKMLALHPTDVLFLELLAVIYKATNNKDLYAIYESILILDPNNVLARSNF